MGVFWGFSEVRGHFADVQWHNVNVQWHIADVQCRKVNVQWSIADVQRGIVNVLCCFADVQRSMVDLPRGNVNVQRVIADVQDDFARQLGRLAASLDYDQNGEVPVRILVAPAIAREDGRMLRTGLGSGLCRASRC